MVPEERDDTTGTHVYLYDQEFSYRDMDVTTFLNDPIAPEFP